MKNTAPVASPLDRLLCQSLAAVTRTQPHDNETLAHLFAALTRIARFYRTTGEVVSQTVIEPGAAIVEVDGHGLLCPRLLVQCTRRDTIPLRPLTFIYTPTRPNRITLQIAYDNAMYPAPDVIQWTSLHEDWCISGHGIELDAETHASFVSSALTRAKLFTLTTMGLEPKTN